TDDDCLAPPGWLDWLEALIEAYPEVDLFAGRTLPVNSGRPGLMERLMTYTIGFPGPLTSAGRGLVNAVTANVACRRKAYAAAGGFNPAMTAAAEDWFLTTRLQDTGASYRVCNEWIMGHKGEQGFRDNLRRYYNYG